MMSRIHFVELFSIWGEVILVLTLVSYLFGHSLVFSLVDFFFGGGNDDLKNIYAYVCLNCIYVSILDYFVNVVVLFF